MSALRLAAPLDRIAVAHHSGPGLRAIVWVQGCSLLCTRVCLNPHLLSTSGGEETTPYELAEAIIVLKRNYRELEGLTVLGGEPFDQAAGLSIALAAIRREGLSTMIYSGHILETLEQRTGARELLRHTDLLVDGPYVEEEHDDSLIWRGSKNQRILCLTDRYCPADIDAAIARQRRSVFISISHRDAVVSGAQTRATAAALRAVARIGQEERLDRF